MLRPLIFCAGLAGLACLMVGVSSGDTPGANVGDSCQSNNDCDRSAGQHCVNNKCVIPGRSGTTSPSAPPPSASSSSPEPASSCPGLPAGYSLKCQLNTGQVLNFCGVAGAIPGPIGTPCHVGYQIGTIVQ
jgi:hypothetical protein